MKLLADENLHGQIVQWLRRQGHDVLWATESLLSEPDHVLLTTAEEQARIVVTADLDFGELIFNQGLNSHGVILLRLEKLLPLERIARLEAIWPVIEANPSGSFIVITPRRVRIRPLSSAP